MTIANIQYEKFNSDWIKWESGDFSIEEKQAGGEAVVKFENKDKVLCLRHLDNKPPLKWSANRQCADAAIFKSVDGSLFLHVVEIKSKVTPGEWIKAKRQCEGMIANAISVLAVGGLDRPEAVVIHVSFATDSTRIKVIDPILIKVPLGSSSPIGDVSDWEKCITTLFGYEAVEVRKIQRDDAGVGVGYL